MSSTELLSRRQCIVNIDLLKTYTDHTEQSALGPHTFRRGDHISYTDVKSGEDINRDGRHTNLWGYQSDTNVYFWLGGTDHPNG